MKKLMFAAVAMAAGVAMADVVSANIVGYKDVDSKMAKNPTMGVVFMPISGGSSVKLGSLKMVSADDPIEDCMDPETECIQKLTTTGAAQDPDAKFTYFSKEYVEMAYDDPDEQEVMMQYVGWWKFEFGHLHVGEEGMSRNGLDVDVGQAFLGELSPAHTLKFTATGEVPCESTYASSGMYKNPFICNYLPVDVPLSNVTVMAEEEDECMDPETECIQKLTTTGAAQDPDAKFTYFSKEYVEMAYDDPDEQEVMMQYVGWWKFEFGHLHVGEEGMDRGAWVWEAGTGLLGELSPAHTLDFNFPSALDVK